MFRYQKILEYPVNVRKKDLKMAKIIATQYGGANSELAAALRYYNQSFTMPTDKGKALLLDTATEELSHIEIICTLMHQLMKGATPAEIKAAGLEGFYSEHGPGLYPTNADGVPFTVTYFAATGDPVADLSEDMAAEEKARAVYENIIDLTTDPDVLGPLLFLRQREIVHFQRFKELYEEYKKQGFK